MDNKRSHEKPACQDRCIAITANDLPLSCPPQDNRLWDAHPRVYLPVEQEKEVICPYCGTKYILQDSSPC